MSETTDPAESGEPSDRRRLAFRTVAELLVVVVGVVLGLAVDRWVRALDERAEEQALIEQLLEDVEADSVLLARMASSFVDYADLVEQVLQAVDDPAFRADDPRAFVATVESAAWWTRLDPERETWDDLVASGRARLLRDAELRRALARYYGRWEYLGEIEQRWRPQLDRYWTEIAGVMPPLLRIEAMRGSAEVASERTITDADVARLLDAFRGDPVLRGSLGTVALLYRFGAPQYESVIVDAAEVLRLLRAQ